MESRMTLKPLPFNRRLDVLVIGGASLDVLHLQAQTVASAGGAGLYTALAAHCAGAKVGMFAPRPDASRTRTRRVARTYPGPDETTRVGTNSTILS
jgi:hypothetical protein